MKKQNDKTWLQIIISGPRTIATKKIKGAEHYGRTT